MSSPPEYVIGTQGWGTKWTSENVGPLVDRLDVVGIKHFDTARSYPPPRPGGSEQLLGSVRKRDFVIDTKIQYIPKGLGRDQMEESVRNSLKDLGIDKIKTLYAHAPDRDIPIADQAANFDYIYKLGHFEQLGLCNYSLDEFTEFIEIAKSNGYILPTVFQGQYNLFCRHYETELFPLLREHGITFVATSPLAGGFATGKLTFARDNEGLKGTRFENAQDNILGIIYRAFYDQPVFHQAMREFAEKVGQYKDQVNGLGQAAMRWVLFHSALQSTDKVAIGPNNLAQLEEYVSARKAGPLPEELAKQIDLIYEPIREAAAPLVQEAGWWRSF